MNPFRVYIFIIIAVAIPVGCASKPPAAISKIPEQNPSLTRVLLDPGRFIGTEVRWGGEITRVENKTAQTWIEIVRRELRTDGKPVASGNSDGRFIASFEGFIDPVVYETGHLLTVVGSIDANTNRPIGEYDYTFPIVSVEGSYLWKAVSRTAGPYYPASRWHYDLYYHYPWPHHRHPRHY
ncbi:MAG: Slp family lipoprotein [Gammaproteobacteria bacterium]|nr:Slp family lipoprotein [Gammaproteobacteria bacterium]